MAKRKPLYPHVPKSRYKPDWSRSDWSELRSYRDDFTPNHRLKEEILRHINEVPDIAKGIDQTVTLTSGETLYLEAWTDRCIKGWGYATREETRQDVYDWDENIEMFQRTTELVTLPDKAKDLGMKLVVGGFYPMPDAYYLYGVTWGVFEGRHG